MRHSPNSNQLLLRLSAMISQYFTRTIMRVYDSAGNTIETQRHAGEFKEP
jgi:hypothetical protein